MHNDPNEFVFKRKRKRLRRLDAQDTEAVAPLDQVGGAQLHSRLIPGIAVLPEPSTSSPAFPDNPEPPSPEASSENIITVETFLRCSVQTAPRTKQAVSDAVSLKKSRAYTHHRATERRTTRVRKVPKRPRESSRIAKTLFRAAVLTDGDPLDTLVDDARISHTRRPLKLVPFNKFATPFRPGQTDSVECSDLGHGEDPVLHTRRHGNASDVKQHHPTSHPRVPLYLVPLQEAEAAYSVMFP
ncbi:hypothetical protein OG21DRAFT_1481682 [Imleria badia]|nr:hypothetical protein OG21DRAFT_1481682 [Imleria badia]